jgi:hypothetical protein
MARHKNANWNLSEKPTLWDELVVAVLMDIRDELQSINHKLGCYRLPRALDDMNSFAKEIRRKQRSRRKRKPASHA